MSLLIEGKKYRRLRENFYISYESERTIPPLYELFDINNKRMYKLSHSSISEVLKNTTILEICRCEEITSGYKIID